MKHQTRKNRRRSHKRKPNRKRRSFRRNRLDIANATLRMKGGSFEVVTDTGHRTIKNIEMTMQLPIKILESLLARLNMFLQRTPAFIYQACCTPAKMKQELGATVIEFTNAWSEMTNVIRRPEEKWTEEEVAAYNAYIAIGKEVLRILVKWDRGMKRDGRYISGAIDLVRDAEEGINWRTAIDNYENHTDRISLQIFIKRYIEMLIVALKVFYSRFYQANYAERRRKLETLEAGLTETIQNITIGAWKKGSRDKMMRQMSALWGANTGICDEFNIDAASIVWRVTQHTKIPGENNKLALFALAIRNIFTIISAKADIIEKNKVCDAKDKHEASKSKRAKRFFSRAKGRERLPNMYTALLIQALAVLWKLGNEHRMLAYMFFPDLITAILVKANEDEVKIYNEEQERRINLLKKTRAELISSQGKGASAVGMRQDINTFFDKLLAEGKAGKIASKGVMQIGNMMKEKGPAHPSYDLPDPLNRIAQQLSNIEPGIMGHWLMRAQQEEQRHDEAMVQHQAGGNGDISTLAITNHFSITGSKGIAGVIRRLTRFFILMLTFPVESGKQRRAAYGASMRGATVGYGGGANGDNELRILAQMAEPPRMYNVGFTVETMGRLPDINQKVILDPRRLTNYYLNKLRPEAVGESVPTLSEKLKAAAELIRLATNNPGIKKRLIQGQVVQSMLEGSKMIKQKHEEQILAQLRKNNAVSAAVAVQNIPKQNLNKFDTEALKIAVSQISREGQQEQKRVLSPQVQSALATGIRTLLKNKKRLFNYHPCIRQTEESNWHR